jgi:tetratricopeptide (TPR) repeat protein
MTISPRSQIGPYEVLFRLGAGGMGEVWKARDTRLGREVAIKVLTEGAASDRDRLRRFVAEAKAASALNHPNILTVHEIGEMESGPYIVTELVDGQTVRELLHEGPIALDRALDIAIQTAEGIAKAHDAGILHRDIKPENLMVTRDGYVKILDFGLAKLMRNDSAETSMAQSSTATGLIVGTAGYLSPEQLRGSPVDARSDVFALGIVLYEMATGENPFRRENAADTFSAILRDEPPALRSKISAAPPDLSAAAARAMAKKPEDRFPGARAFAAELKRIRASRQSGAISQTAETQIQLAPSRRGPNIAAVAAGVAAIAVAAAFLVGRRSGSSGNMPALPANQLAVAVLPIQNQSGDSELERQGIGKILSDAFVQVLSDLPKIYVVSPLRLDTVAREQGKQLAAAGQDTELAHKICSKAGATAMLMGSLGKVGKTYVLHASLYELPSDRILSSFHAESQSSDQLLPDLTGTVASMVRSKLGPGANAAPAGTVDKVATASLDAYSHFMRGREMTLEGNWNGAIPELKKALEIDPQMALAWSELACAYSFAGDDANSQAAQQKTEEYADRVNRKERFWIEQSAVWVKTGNGAAYRKAIEKYIREYPDERDGYFYAGLGAQWLDKNCQDALTFYARAYSLTPNYYPITKAIVDCELEMNRKDRAVEALKRYLKVPLVGEHGRTQAQWRLAEIQKKS